MGSGAVNTVRVHTAGAPAMEKVNEEKEEVDEESAMFAVSFCRFAWLSFVWCVVSLTATTVRLRGPNRKGNFGLSWNTRKSVGLRDLTSFR